MSLETWDQFNEISRIALSGRAIALALAAEDNFKMLRPDDVAAILDDLLLKFEQIDNIANPPTNHETESAA